MSYRCDVSNRIVPDGVTMATHTIMRPVIYQHWIRKYNRAGYCVNEYIKSTSQGYEPLKVLSVHPSLMEGEDGMPTAVIDPRETKTIKCYLN